MSHWWMLRQQELLTLGIQKTDTQQPALRPESPTNSTSGRKERKKKIQAGNQSKGAREAQW